MSFWDFANAHPVVAAVMIYWAVEGVVSVARAAGKAVERGDHG